MIRKRGNNSKTGQSSTLLLYYCAIVKYMCLFFDQLTSYLPNQVSRSVVLKLGYAYPWGYMRCTEGVREQNTEFWQSFNPNLK